MIKVTNSIKNKLLISVLILGIFLYLITDANNFFNFAPQGQIAILKLQDFITLILSIVVEAFPFVILGVVISVLVGIGFFETVVKVIKKNKNLLFPFYLIIVLLNRIDELAKGNRVYEHFKVSIMGIFLPVCECGNIPVARRLLLNGYSVSQSITFLLAAPILNPVTFLTTAEAFSFDRSVVIIRMLSGFIIANFVGIVLSYKKNQNELLTDSFYHEVCEVHEHHHHKNKVDEALEIFQHEFIDIIKALCIGAVLAATFQTFIPRDIITSIGQNPILSIVAMILLALFISICSNVDAFFALSYANSFTIGSILSFLVFGPMIDIKILTMMKTTYKLKLLVIVTTFVTLLSFLVGLIVNYYK